MLNVEKQFCFAIQNSPKNLLQLSRTGFESYCKESELFKSLDKNHDGVTSLRELTSKEEMAFKVSKIQRAKTARHEKLTREKNVQFLFYLVQGKL